MSSRSTGLDPASGWVHPYGSAGPAVLARRMETALSSRTWSVGGLEGECVVRG